MTELEDPPVPARWTQIVAAAAVADRPIQQRPPAFSALKVGGRRAYDLARRGEQVELKPRAGDGLPHRGRRPTTIPS